MGFDRAPPPCILAALSLRRAWESTHGDCKTDRDRITPAANMALRPKVRVHACVAPLVTAFYLGWLSTQWVGGGGGGHLSGPLHLTLLYSV